MSNEKRSKAIANLIKTLYFNDDQVDVFVKGVIKRAELLGKKIKMGEDLVHAKEQLFGENFLNHFSHGFANFSDEEIDLLIKMHQSPEMQKLLKASQVVIPEFFEKAMELFVQD